jgi:hypothetical protein
VVGKLLAPWCGVTHRHAYGPASFGSLAGAENAVDFGLLCIGEVDSLRGFDRVGSGFQRCG